MKLGRPLRFTVHFERNEIQTKWLNSALQNCTDGQFGPRKRKAVTLVVTRKDNSKSLTSLLHKSNGNTSPW